MDRGEAGGGVGDTNPKQRAFVGTLLGLVAQLCLTL